MFSELHFLNMEYMCSVAYKKKRKVMLFTKYGGAAVPENLIVFHFVQINGIIV